MSQTLNIIDKEIITLFKDGDLSIKQNEIIDFVSPIKEQFISSLRSREFSDLKKLLKNLFELLFQEEYIYCITLDSSYKQIKFNCSDFKFKIKNLLFNIIKKPNESQNLSVRFLEFLDIKKSAVNYFATFHTLSRDSRNLLIANRNAGWIKKGWNQFGKNLQITEDLQGDVFGNFGFGKSSYFYILLTYKDIPITTFTDYIKYEFVSGWEVVRYTRRFYQPFYKNDEFGNVTRTVSINYGEWSNLMSYVISLANIPVCDSEHFFLNYINREFRTMVQQLKEMHTSENYVFYKNTEEENGNIKEVPYTVGLKEGLLTYKTEKIFGTLSFFTTLNKRFLIENKDSVDTLFALYKLQFPNLQKERLEIISKTPIFEEKLTAAKKQLKTYIDENFKVILLEKTAHKVDKFGEEDEKMYAEYLEEKNKVSIVEKGLVNLRATIMRVEKYEKDYLELCETFSF